MLLSAGWCSTSGFFFRQSKHADAIVVSLVINFVRDCCTASYLTQEETLTAIVDAKAAAKQETAENKQKKDAEAATSTLLWVR